MGKGTGCVGEGRPKALQEDWMAGRGGTLRYLRKGAEKWLQCHVPRCRRLQVGSRFPRKMRVPCWAHVFETLVRHSNREVRRYQCPQVPWALGMGGMLEGRT